MSTNQDVQPLSSVTSPLAKRSIVGFLNRESTRAILSVRAEMVSLMLEREPDWEEYRRLAERLVGLCVATGIELGAEVKGLLYLGHQRGWGAGEKGKTRDAGDVIPVKAKKLGAKLRLAD